MFICMHHCIPHLGTLASNSQPCPTRLKHFKTYLVKIELDIILCHFGASNLLVVLVS